MVEVSWLAFFLCWGKELKTGNLTGVHDVHAAHSAAGIVEEPLVRVVMMGVDLVRVLLVQLGGKEADDSGSVVRVGGDGALGEVLELVHVEEVELLEVLLEQVYDRAQQAHYHGHDREDLGQAAAAERGRRRLPLLLLLLRRRLGFGFGRHDSLFWLAVN